MSTHHERAWITDALAALAVVLLAGGLAAPARADDFSRAQAHARCTALSTDAQTSFAHHKAGIAAMRKAYGDGDGRRLLRDVAYHWGMSHDEAVAYLYGRDAGAADTAVFNRVDKALALGGLGDEDARRSVLKDRWYADANCGLLIGGRR